MLLLMDFCKSLSKLYLPSATMLFCSTYGFRLNVGMFKSPMLLSHSFVSPLLGYLTLSFSEAEQVGGRHGIRLLWFGAHRFTKVDYWIFCHLSEGW